MDKEKAMARGTNLALGVSLFAAVSSAALGACHPTRGAGVFPGLSVNAGVGALAALGLGLGALLCVGAAAWQAKSFNWRLTLAVAMLSPVAVLAAPSARLLAHF